VSRCEHGTLESTLCAPCLARELLAARARAEEAEAERDEALLAAACSTPDSVVLDAQAKHAALRTDLAALAERWEERGANRYCWSTAARELRALLGHEETDEHGGDVTDYERDRGVAVIAAQNRAIRASRRAHVAPHPPPSQTEVSYVVESPGAACRRFDTWGEAVRHARARFEEQGGLVTGWSPTLYRETRERWPSPWTLDPETDDE